MMLAGQRAGKELSNRIEQRVFVLMLVVMSSTHVIVLVVLVVDASGDISSTQGVGRRRISDGGGR
jgi:hypothetical protein